MQQRPPSGIVLKGLSGAPVFKYCDRDLVAVACEVTVNNVTNTLVISLAHFPHDNDSVFPVRVRRIVEHCRRKIPP